MLRRLFYSFSQFMAGRYGTDHLNRFLLVMYLVLWVFSSLFVRSFWVWRGLSMLSTLLAFWLLFRTLSRNISRRQAENRWFLSRWAPVKGWFARGWMRLRDGGRCRYRRCPGCGCQLRLPVKRGRRTVTCHRCHTQFKAFFL